jgi:hypothetical protein
VCGERRTPPRRRPSYLALLGPAILPIPPWVILYCIRSQSIIHVNIIDFLLSDSLDESW